MNAVVFGVSYSFICSQNDEDASLKKRAFENEFESLRQMSHSCVSGEKEEEKDECRITFFPEIKIDFIRCFLFFSIYCYNNSLQHTRTI